MTGINKPVPEACISLPTNKMGKVGAIAQMMVPMVNMIIVPRNSCLVVNHCSNRADAGITIPIININPVAIYCTVGNETPNSPLM